MKQKARIDGEGSIYPDGDSYVAQISIKGRLYRRRRKTEAEALVALDELRDRRRRRLNLSTDMPTLEAWIETWLSTNRKLRESVRADYRAIVKRYITPSIGHYRLNEITTAVLQDLVGDLDDKGLSQNTIKNAMARVRTALTKAVKDQKIERNPAIELEITGKRKRQAVALTQDEAQAFLQAVENHRLYALYYLALTLGMRQGELLALRWSDISWTRQTLAVRRTLRRIGKKTHENPTKTVAGERVLDLADEHVQVLRAHWAAQQEESSIAAKLGMAEWNADGRVFCTDTGRPIDARNLLRHFHTVREAAELPAMTFHHLRHTAGSLMLYGGTDMLDVSQILGHSSVSVTQTVYAHSYGDKRKKAIVELAGKLRRKAE